MGMSEPMTLGRVSFALTISAVSFTSSDFAIHCIVYVTLTIAPVVSVLPTQDAQTYLTATLDSRIRLMDMSSGRMLNEFKAHLNDSYRCRACFGHGEASVICGDEKGQVWAWDLVSVIIVYERSSYCGR